MYSSSATPGIAGLAATSTGAAGAGLAFTGFPVIGFTLLGLVVLLAGLILLRSATVGRAVLAEVNDGAGDGPGGGRRPLPGQGLDGPGA